MWQCDLLFYSSQKLDIADHWPLVAQTRAYTLPAFRLSLTAASSAQSARNRNTSDAPIQEAMRDRSCKRRA